MTIRLDSDLGISASGNVTGNYFIGDGSQLTNVGASSYGNANVQALLNSGAFTGDIIPAGNATQSLGSNTNQWLDLWVSNATIYLNSIPLGVNANGVLQFDGNDLVTSGANVVNTGNIDTTGNIIGGNLVIATGGLTFADGSTQTSSYSDANVAAYLPTYTGDITAQNITISGSTTANFITANIQLYAGVGVLTDGNIDAVGNVTGNYFIGDGSLLTGLPASYGNANVEAYLPVSNTIIGINSNVANTNSNVTALNLTVANLATASSLANTDANVANLVTVTTNTDSNVANLVTITTNTDSNVAILTSDLSNTNNNVGNLTITVGNQGNAIANLQSSTYSNANVDSYLPVYTGNIAANIVTATTLAGEGGNIANITGANVTGEVASANVVTNPSQTAITQVGTLTSLTAGAVLVNGLFTANANAQFNGNVFFAGNVTLPGNINQISGNSATFFGDPVTGFGALYAGLISGYTPLGQEVVQFADNFNSYAQVSHQNINPGDQSTTDYVATASNGTDTTNFVNMGVAGGGYNGALANNSLGTSLFANDGYLYAQGNVGGGNLVIGSNQAGGVVRIIANGASNIGDVIATFAANGLTIGSITATSGSPAPVVSGFIFSGLSANIIGNVTGNLFIGNGSLLTNITGANVTGTVPSATVSTSVISGNSGVEFAASGGNIELTVGGVAVADISNTTIGISGAVLATGNITGSFFIGDGSQLTNLPGGTGDITFVNTTMSAPPDEDITIETLKDDGTTGSQLYLDPSDAYLRLEQYSTQDNQSFSTADWATGTYTSQGVPPSIGVIEFTGADTIINFVNSLQGTGQIFLSVNGGPLQASQGEAGGGSTISFYVADMPAVDPTTVTTFEYYYSYNSRIEIDYDDGTFGIESNNLEFSLSTTGGRDIDINSSRSLYMAGQNELYLTNFSTVNGVDIRTNADGATNTWSFGANGNLTLAPINLSGGGESAQLIGTRTIVNGISSGYPYAAELTPGTATLAYQTSPGVVSTRITFAVQSSGVDAQWEQFDVVATASNQEIGEVNFVVSNRVKATTVIADTLVTAAVVSGALQISLTVAATQTAAYTTYSAVEFGIMLD